MADFVEPKSRRTALINWIICRQEKQVFGNGLVYWYARNNVQSLVKQYIKIVPDMINMLRGLVCTLGV